MVVTWEIIKVFIYPSLSLFDSPADCQPAWNKLIREKEWKESFRESRKKEKK